MLRPPPILILQLLNAALGMATYLVMTLGQARWAEAGYSLFTTSCFVAGGMVVYAACVGFGGQLAERIGRARTALIGIIAVVAGAALPILFLDAWAPAAAWSVMNLGCALFFPANAGLFSDAEGARGTPPPPLARKVSNYNLGWAGGNLMGFSVALALGTWSNDGLGFIIALALAAAMGLTLLPWRSLPPMPPAADGDRSTHPHLDGLTIMSRRMLFCACLFGMAVLALGQPAIHAQLPGQGADVHESSSLSRTLWLGYAAGYVSMFVLLGFWEGWILRPYRLLLIQSGLVIAALGHLSLGAGWLTLHHGWLLALGLCQGLGYGAVYTGSLYYSLRLPQGASSAAGKHEAALGLGSLLGIAGSAVVLWAVPGLMGLGLWGLFVCVMLLTLQIISLQRLPRIH